MMNNFKKIIKKNRIIYSYVKRAKNKLFGISLQTIDKKEVDNKIKSFQRIGVRQCDGSEKVMISLTSFPARINEVKYTIYSLLNQTYKPNKIVLWLGEDKFINKESDLPKELLDFTQKGLSIKFVKDLRSYTKLIPALQNYGDYLIITVDDDIYYPPTLVEKLMHEHNQYPECIVAYRVYRIGLSHNRILSYSKWEKETTDQIETPSFLNFFTGVGGVLYNIKLLHKDIFHEDVFMNLCPQADDVWFNAMAALQGTRTKIVKDGNYSLCYVNPENEEVGINTLGSYNINQDGNDQQIHAVLKYYPELMSILKDDALIK